MENEMISVEETLQYASLPSGLKSFVVDSEVIESPHAPLVFLGLMTEKSIEGQIGRSLVFPKVTALSASSIVTSESFPNNPEEYLHNTGYQSSDKVVTAVSAQVLNLIYSATTLSDVLSEDMPVVDWIRLNLRNMASAVMEFLEAMARDMFLASAGLTKDVTGSLDYDSCVEALAQLKNQNYVEGSRVLVICPDTEAILLKDVKFVASARYSAGEIVNMITGEVGKFAGCTVAVSPLMDGIASSLIIVPQGSPYGTVSVLLYKRRLTVKSERHEANEETFTVTSIRAGVAVLQPNAVLRIDQTITP